MKNITLTLYAFHLKQGLGDSLETIKNQGVQLWESLIKLSNVYPFPNLQNLKSHLVSYTQDEQGNYSYQPEKEETSTGECLTPQQEVIQLSKIATSQGFNLTGEIEPYLLNDTYCLTLTLKPTDYEFELGLSDLTAFHSHCLIKDITADLGKTLVFYGEQDDGSQPSFQDAEKWAIALCANSGLTPEFRGTLTFFHCPGFWFEASGLTLWILLAKPNQFAGDKFSDKEPIFRGVLWSFFKINSTYVDVKEAYENAKKYYENLESKGQEFYTIIQKLPRERLQDLDKMIQSIPKDLLYYHSCLRDLKTHQATITTNIQNFQTTLGHLIAAEGNEFKVWSTLAEKTYPRYLEQIELYLKHLEPGQVLFSDLINTIRATTELEQAKANQELQDHIQAIGVGIAAGAIVASTSGLITQPWQLPTTERLWLPPHPFILAFLASVVCSLAAWKGAKCLIASQRK